MSVETTAETEARLRGQGWSDGDIRWWRQGRGSRASSVSQTLKADPEGDEATAFWKGVVKKAADPTGVVKASSDPTGILEERNSGRIQRREIEVGADHWRAVLGKK